MPPLWLSILIGIVGLGGPVNLSLRWLFPSLTAKTRMVITVTLLASLIAVAQWYVEYPTEQRYLANWQRGALADDCQAWKLLKVYVGSAPRELEAEDYSRQFMSVFNHCGLTAAYSYDPFPNALVVNGKKVIV